MPDAAQNAPGARTPAPASLDAAALLSALSGGAAALAAQADAINAINVFPVPDGDTGTNMSLTMRAAVDAAMEHQHESPGSVLKAAARGALMGAKGNSGVILSQILAGLAAVPGDHASLGGSDLADGLERAREAAYRVVSAPTEGTILTAISAAAAAANTTEGDAEAVLAAAVDACRDAVERTPELLPVLKEAGVVDSGAQGLYVTLDGMLRALRGDSPADLSGSLGAIDTAWLGATKQLHDHGDAAGFCTEFVLAGPALDAVTLRGRLLEMGESVLVVGGEDVLRVHVHTHDPEAVFAHARTMGEVSREKADDMGAQFRALASRDGPRPQPALAGIAVVAVAAGDGLRDLFASTGAAAVVHGGQTMNPSAGDIRAAIDATGADDVIVLPNNKNIIMAARQAAEGLPQRVRVIDTRSVPQGVAALVALNTEAPFEENVTAMTDAAASVRSGEVTLAARSTRLGGVEVREGQPIGIVDGELAVAADTVESAVRDCVARMLDGRDGALVTLYSGDGVAEDAADELAERLRGEFGVEVEMVRGGQPHYPYLIGVE
jgi:DAK2 domain fusion protein YloV